MTGHPSMARIAEMRRPEFFAEAARQRHVRRSRRKVAAESGIQASASRTSRLCAGSRRLGWFCHLSQPEISLGALAAGVIAGSAALLLGADDAEAGVVIHGG
jgi:hypothetical protein